ncbi:MAG: response regulator [Rhizobiaceae bacterium]
MPTKDIPESTKTGLRKGRNILVVEDNGTNRLVLSHKLSKMGFEVCCAENGLEAIKFLDRVHIDLILMDVSMPVMDGLEATRRIRQRESNDSSVSIVGFSAHNHAEVRGMCIDAGMDDFLCKPATDEHMFDKLNRILTTSG